MKDPNEKNTPDVQTPPAPSAADLAKKLAEVQAAAASLTAQLAEVKAKETQEKMAKLSEAIQEFVNEKFSISDIPAGFYVRFDMLTIDDENGEKGSIITCEPHQSAATAPRRSRSRGNGETRLSNPGTKARAVQDAYMANKGLTNKELAERFATNSGAVWNYLHQAGLK